MVQEMNTKIVQRMSEIVAETMTRFQSDFEQYDRPYMETAMPKQFPMLWLVANTHTHLLKLGDYYKRFFEDEAVRYAYAAGDDTFSDYFEIYKSDRIFLITLNGINEITTSQAKEVIRDIVTPVAAIWVKQNGPLPKDTRMPIKFFNVTFNKIKELIRDCEKHNDTSLINILHRFRNYRRTAANQYIQISYVPGWNEFWFREYTNGKPGLAGGIVFHGWPETGYQTNNSIQLTPQYGWASHT